MIVLFKTHDYNDSNNSIFPQPKYIFNQKSIYIQSKQIKRLLKKPNKKRVKKEDRPYWPLFKVTRVALS